MNYILDASVTLSWCFKDEATSKTKALLMLLEDNCAFVPEIWPLEVGNILVMAEKRKRITFANAVEFISLLENINITIDHETSAHALHDTLSLAHTEGLTTYDAAYLELAMRMGLPLATKDKLLRKSAARLGVEIA